MTVIADTSPLNYLILIGRVDVLRDLYGQVIIPDAVFNELQNPKTPETVRNWAANYPDWFIVKTVTIQLSEELLDLHIGEAEAITLAQELNAELLIIDERKGREIAFRHGFEVTGILGVLRDAAARNLLDLKAAFNDLQKTSFRVSPQLIQDLLEEESNDENAIN